MMGNKLVLEGQLVGVYNDGNNSFFARINLANHEIDLPCDRDTFHGMKFGDATLTLEILPETKKT